MWHQREYSHYCDLTVRTALSWSLSEVLSTSCGHWRKMVWKFLRRCRISLNSLWKINYYLLLLKTRAAIFLPLWCVFVSLYLSLCVYLCVCVVVCLCVYVCLYSSMTVSVGSVCGHLYVCLSFWAFSGGSVYVCLSLCVCLCVCYKITAEKKDLCLLK